ncbi:MAG TPA: Hsp20/alpha crystallin family protein [Thermoanaerobaculia bacterium]|nr:Hsp20/alpha crystallin family protein [Thermoanaerobaculia bacterium]
MSTVRWNTLPDLKTTLQGHIGRMLLEPFARLHCTDEDLVSGNFVPAVDVAETADHILVRAELPGVKQDEVSIDFENGILTIRGERKLEKETEGVTWHRVERSYGNFLRSFTLPRTVDPEKIAASYRDGILEIDIPKKEEAKPKQIKIDIKA